VTHEGNGGSTTAFRHQALLFRSRDEHDRAVAEFAAEGLDGGDALLLVMGPRSWTELRRRLGPRVAAAAVLEPQVLYASPAWGIARVRREVDLRSAAGTRLRVVTEPRWWKRPVEEWEGWISADAVANAAFGADPVDILCAYDEDAAPPEVLEAAAHTHPELLVDGHSRQNPSYTDPALYCARHRQRPLSPLPPPVEEHAFSGATLAELRRVVAAWATDGGLPPGRVPEVVLAVHEVTTNSVRHAGGEGTLRLAATDDELVAEVRDAGVISAPFAGLLPPSIGEGGYGLWLVHQLVERVLIRSGADGSAVRLHVRRRPSS
jgi:anti-sigma regulatory factor (Ser/Thr protein kinase)